MKLRIEQFGLHYFDRNTGMHFLVDEIIPKKEDHSIAPRTFSIAITNDCNSNCSFCHIPKGKTYLTKDYIVNFCKKVDALGSIDIAIGGGEPLLHPDIVEICKGIWNNTKLGISITTNGQLLSDTLINQLIGSISFFRVSFDSVNEHIYRDIRGFDFETLKANILKLKGKIPFGLNMVVNEKTILFLDENLQFAQKVGAEELLLLPIISDGKISLNNQDLKQLEIWIQKNYKNFSIRILEQVRKKIKVPVLFEDDSYYFDYLYLSAHKELQNNSYDQEKGQELEIENIESTLKIWRMKHGL